MGVRCPDYLYGLTAGADTIRSEFHMDGHHRADDGSDDNQADLDCDTGCGTEVGNGDCVVVGATGNGLVEIQLASLVAGGDGWIHQDDETPTTDATVDKPCGDHMYRLTVPGRSSIVKGTTELATSYRNQGTDDDNLGDFAELICQNGVASLDAGGLGSATCTTC